MSRRNRKLPTPWTYVGDRDLRYGGTFYDFSNWEWGYVDAIEIVDLASAIGYNDAYLIEQKTINCVDDPEKLNRALPAVGAKLLDDGNINDNGRIVEKDSEQYKNIVAYALMSYGTVDTENETTVIIGPDAEDKFDGWKSQKRLRSNVNLWNYVIDNHIR